MHIVASILASLQLCICKELLFAWLRDETDSTAAWSLHDCVLHCPVKQSGYIAYNVTVSCQQGRADALHTASDNSAAVGCAHCQSVLQVVLHLASHAHMLCLGFAGAADHLALLD